MQSDAGRLQELYRQHGLERGRGRMYGRNDCLADSLLQALAHAGVVPELTVSERNAACLANRARLNASPDVELRPRRRDPATGADEGMDELAFLEHDKHAESTVQIFTDRLRDRQPEQEPIVRQIRLVVFPRFDSSTLPASEIAFPSATHGDASADRPVVLRLYNLLLSGSAPPDVAAGFFAGQRRFRRRFGAWSQ